MAMWYNLNTIYFPNRDELKVKIARTDPQVREELRRKAAELARKYEEIAKSYDADIKNYPKAAAGLKRSQEKYYERARELKAFAEGKGDVPDWFAKMFVSKVTYSQLKRVGYDPTHPSYLVHHADQDKTPVIPKYAALIQNTGIKTVPKPQLKPSIVGEQKKFWLNPAPNPTVPHSVHQVKNSQGTTDYKKLGLYVVGAILAYIILKRFVR